MQIYGEYLKPPNLFSGHIDESLTFIDECLRVNNL